MQQTVHSTTTAPGQDRTRLRRAAGMLAVSAVLALGATACGGAQANPAASASGTPGHITAGGAGSGTGGTGGSGQRSTGGFSLAFAKCMRAHGVPDFPDPNGQVGQLSPESGINPNSPQFRSALNGPCKPLAPLGWVSSGKVTR
jgi:hypothetical protein